MYAIKCDVIGACGALRCDFFGAFVVVPRMAQASSQLLDLQSNYIKTNFKLRYILVYLSFIFSCSKVTRVLSRGTCLYV